MASLDKKLNVGIHERNSHGDIRPIGEYAAFVRTLLLDAIQYQPLTSPTINRRYSQTEDIVPSTTIQPSRVFLQLIKNFLHLESSR